METEMTCTLGGPNRPDKRTMAKVIARLADATRIPFIAKFIRVTEPDSEHLLACILELWDNSDSLVLLEAVESAEHTEIILPDSILKAETLQGKIAATEAMIAQEFQERARIQFMSGC